MNAALSATRMLQVMRDIELLWLDNIPCRTDGIVGDIVFELDVQQISEFQEKSQHPAESLQLMFWPWMLVTRTVKTTRMVRHPLPSGLSPLFWGYRETPTNQAPRVVLRQILVVFISDMTAKSRTRRC